MSRLRLFPLALLALSALCACNSAQSPPQVAQVKQPYQRFIPVPREPNLTGVPWSGAFALDTKTGQLCTTYDQSFSIATHGDWTKLPACKDLLTGFPD